MSEQAPKNHHYTETYHPDGYVYLGKTDRTHVVILKPHRTGLSVYSSHQLYARGSRGCTRLGRASKRYLIPGQYSLSAVGNFLLALTGDSPSRNDKNVQYKSGKATTTSAARRLRRIKSILVESGLWARRGLLHWSNTPRRFFSAVRVEDFVRGSTHSYGAWWKTYLYNTDHDAMTVARAEIRQQNLSTETAVSSERGLNHRAYCLRRKEINTGIARGTLPAFPHLIRGWGKLPLKYLVHAVKRQYLIRSKWEAFIDRVLPRISFHRLMQGMNQFLWSGDAEEFDATVAYLERLDPRLTATDIARLTDDNIAFARSMDACSKTEFHAMVTARDAYDTALKIHRERRVRASYRPPNIMLPPGWEFATKNTLDSILRSQPSIYDFAGISRRIADGRAHVVAHRNNGWESIVAVLGYDSVENERTQEWQIQKVYAGRGPIAPRHLMALQGIVNRIKMRMPGPARAQQQTLRDAYIWEMAQKSALASRMICCYYDHLRSQRSDFSFDCFEPKMPTPGHLAYRRPAEAIARLEKVYKTQEKDLSELPF